MASNNNSNTHNANPGQQSSSTGLGHPHPQQHQQPLHHHQSHHHHHHDPHGSAGVPLMHVDELLSAEFPLNMGNGGHHASGPLNSGAQANIMEGLDDLFGDDFSTTNAATITTTAVTTGAIAHSSSNNVGLPMVHLPQGSQPQHATAQALPPNMHFPTSGPTHSPQPRVLQQHPHQQPSPAALDSPSAIPAPLTPGHHTPGARITPQTPQPVSTAHVSHAPQITAGMHAMQQNRQQAVATPGLPQQYQQQQAVLQQQQAALQQHQQQQQQAAQHHAHLAQQSLQPTGAPRPVFPSPQHHHAALNQATALLPRPVQPNIVQMPSTTSTPVVPNGHTPIPTVATPAIVTPAAAPTPTPAPAAPVVLAGSPLHHILGTTSPETGQQLRDLFTLLQTNVVSPNEFLARAEQLLEPAQFKILDGIRRRHVPQAQQQQLPPQQSNPASAASTPAANSPATTANASAASSPMHQPQPTTTGVARPSGVQHISTPAVPTPVQPATPQPTPVAPAATVPQAAPVRKRPIDPTSVANSANESKTKRPKMEQQQNAVGVGAVNGAAAGPLTPALPSASGPATPGIVASPGAFKGVSLPGQHRAVTVAPSTAAPGAAGGAGAATGATAATTGTTARSSGGGGGGAASTERVNYDNITDVMGYVGGVDLREETDNIMRDSDGYSKSGGGDGQDRTRIQNFVDIGLLKTIIERIAATHKVQTIEPDVLAYMAMATQERLRGLAEQMVHASKHRGRSLATANPSMYDEEHAMYRVGVSQDVKKQLLAVERVEREEETKRKEHIAERERRLAAGEDLDENGDPRGGPGGAGAKKSKKQKEGGPGVSARNMTEEARKKVANQTAMGFAGGSGRTYSWMMGSGGAGGGGLGGGAASPSPLAGPPIVASTGTGSTAGSPSASGVAANGPGGPLKPSLTRGSTMPASTTPSGALTPGGGAGGGDGGAAGSGAVGSPSLVRGAGVGGSMILPPSTLGRPTNLRDSSRKVNVRDALFCLERDRGGGGGEGSGQRVLVKSYVKWLK